MLLQLMDKISLRQKKLLFWVSLPVVVLAIAASVYKTFVLPKLGYKQGLLFIDKYPVEFTWGGNQSPEEIECLEVNYPSEIEMDGSKTIKLSILRMTTERLVSRYKDKNPEVKEVHTESDDMFTGPFEHEGMMIRINPLTPLELTSPLKDAFGQEYKAVANAELITTAFDSKSDIPPGEGQSLELPEVTWKWVVSPKQPNTQSLFITILLEWKNKNNGDLKQHRIRTDNFNIEVYKPFLTTGQVNIAALLVGLIGSGLSFPWLYDRYKERKNRRPLRVIGYVQSQEHNEATRSKQSNVHRVWLLLLSRLKELKLRRGSKSK
jgi:hypothetical protein